ncbi:MAG TPA: hypothetical protein VFI47_25430 [Acidimicrobiales bacterium]|nr:hypothetical protein [Acidimicrobiales bacterium]
MTAGGSTTGGPDDPFEGLSLDDEFVRGAKVQEASGDDRIERVRRIEAEHRRLADERLARQRAAERTIRRERRRPRRVLVVVVAGVAALIGWSVLFEDGSGSGSGDVAGGLGVDEPTDAAAGRDLVTGEADVRGLPSPSDEQQDAPLGAPAPVATESAAFRFSQIQPGTAEPVAFDPCRPIHVVHNVHGAPGEAETLLAEALDDVGRATGLQFDLEGETDEPPDLARGAFQPDRYGDRWAPVLVAWSDAAEVADLAGGTAGVGGSTWVEVDTARVYVTGVVVLDAPDMRDVVNAQGRDGVTAVIRHELAHVVGLDHVDDDEELMHPVARPDVVTFGPGDLTGLAELGRGQCFPEI